MGLLDWFKTPSRSNVTCLDDVIWLTKPAKLAGIGQAVADALAGGNPPDAALLVAHFRDGLSELQRLVNEGGFARAVAVVLAEDLRGATAGLSLDASRTVLIVVAERHPLRSHDEAVVEFARGLPCRSRVVHHVALDDPMMRMFAGEWIANLLKRLDLKEEEGIESQMVMRRIRGAQDRIAATGPTDFPADSADEWMRRNLPGH